MAVPKPLLAWPKAIGSKNVWNVSVERAHNLKVPEPPPSDFVIALFLTRDNFERVRKVRLKRDIEQSIQIAAQFFSTVPQPKSLKGFRRVEVHLCMRNWADAVALEGEEKGITVD